MTATPTPPASTSTPLSTNVGLRLGQMAARFPDLTAVAAPRPKKGNQPRRYDTLSFRELEQDSNRLAAGMLEMGMRRGDRIALLTPPGIDFISLVFAMFKAGVVTVLIDPGMGKGNLLQCLEETQPDGFVGIPLVQAVRILKRRRFPQARHNVTVGRRWFWGGPTIANLRRANPAAYRPLETDRETPAAIIFTTGSTGPPKGVHFTHGNFSAQADQIQERYQIEPGGVDLAGFPLFALFNCAMGVTTVIPDMDPTRPADIDPRNVLEAVRDWNVTQAFGSPAIWNVVGRYCETHNEKLPTLRRVLSAGAPVPPHVLQRMKAAIHPEGDIFTPYGATESLPVASISASEVLGETAAKTAVGAGTCVGRRFSGIQWKVIRATSEPLETMAEVEEMPRGEIGEIIVQGPVVTKRYETRTEANRYHKIQDGDSFWHRIGDLGYFDEQERFWFCGRKTHCVHAAHGPMYTIPCEAIFNEHPRVYRSALVGVGAAENARPVMIVETWPECRITSPADEQTLLEELLALGQAHEHTRPIADIMLHASLPVDIRHNAKIFREKLAPWAERQLQNQV